MVIVIPLSLGCGTPSKWRLSMACKWKTGGGVPGSTCSSAVAWEFGKLWPSGTLWTAMPHGFRVWNGVGFFGWKKSRETKEVNEI